MNKPTFASLGLSQELCARLTQKGFEHPTPIQEQAIPILLQGKLDMIGQAQTGTGKTAAFGLPIISTIEGGSQTPQALVLAPTRELAIQVAEELRSFGADRKLKICTIYGGQSIEVQIKQLRRGVDIVVGTPGRIKDHLKRKTLNVRSIQFMVLDEADEMLNMGFIDDVEEILKHTNDYKRMLLFSATMPTPIMKLAEKYMREYKVVAVKAQQLTTHLTEQSYYAVPARDKTEALCRIIDITLDFYGIVFCRTKRDVDTVTSKLVDRGYSTEGLHGDISQGRRERILQQFKRKKITILVATDVAARGIDVNNLTHVVNYALPEDPESYVHRIGRTGRAGNKGTAISLVSPSESRRLSLIKRVAKADIKRAEPPKTDDIIAAKKARIIEDIKAILANKTHEKHVPFAQELLELGTPEEVFAAVLKRAFKQELDTKGYANISDAKFSKNSKTTRLFVARGKVDGMNAKKLVEFIAGKTNMNGRDISGVSIMDNFSFITVPGDDADMVIKSFRSRDRRQKPLVTRAKAR